MPCNTITKLDKRSNDKILTSIALGELSTLAAIIAPCSEKAYRLTDENLHRLLSVNLAYDKKGELVGIDIDNAAEKFVL